MEKFYFTYGSDERFPYQYGWTEIEAPDMATACAAFRHFHPDRDPEAPCFNCAAIYPEAEFQNTGMYVQANYHDRCRERITMTLMREPLDKDNEMGDVAMKPDKRKKKRLREIARNLASTAMTLFGLSIMRGVVILDVDAKNGSVLLGSGIEKFADIHDLPVEIEPDEDENGPFAFKVVRLNGGIEVLQVDDEYVPEESNE